MRDLILDIAMSSPALKELSGYYPPGRYGKVPLKVKMIYTVKNDPSIIIQPEPDVIACAGQEYFVWCNSHGAMAAIMPNGKKLGIRSSECEIIEWHA